MSAVEQRIYVTADGEHVVEGDERAEVLAFAPGDDVPADVLKALGDAVTVAPDPEPQVVVEPPAPEVPRGSRLRVFRTADGGHVLDGDPAAEVLVYTPEDDVPDEVLAELGLGAKAAKKPADKSRRPAGDKSSD